MPNLEREKKKKKVERTRKKEKEARGKKGETKRERENHDITGNDTNNMFHSTADICRQDIMRKITYICSSLRMTNIG